MVRFWRLGQKRTSSKIMNATTTCTLSNPVDFQGNAPTAITDVWNFDTQSCNSSYDTTSSTVSVSSGFTYGELVISWLLFIFLIAFLYNFLYHWISGYKTHL